ncbi:MAG: hypothetical protein OJF52_004375 [Nitrospira sp.]|nr:MAG: hypothetical protein OJF52_004375 [Nitrospira sp.]
MMASAVPLHHDGCGEAYGRNGVTRNAFSFTGVIFSLYPWRSR